MEEEYNLKELFEDQIKELKDDYGYLQKHFIPLVTNISKQNITMLFCGIEINLNSNGTYFIVDTTGG